MLYLRYSNKVVAQTIRDKDGYVSIDVDEEGNVVGMEVIGDDPERRNIAFALAQFYDLDTKGLF